MIRILVAGLAAIGFGGWWFIQSLADPKTAIPGGIWKGPLICVLGLAAAGIAVRALLSTANATSSKNSDGANGPDSKNQISD